MAGMTEGRIPELWLILQREPDQSFALYACQGHGKGCSRNRYRKQLKACADCRGPLSEYLTVADVAAMIARGDA